MINVIATIPGRRPERIILASHYDTKRAPDFRFVGASDGASSTAALLELGRVLKARQNEFTIELLFLDGEEAVNWEWRDPDNTYGSRYYVQAARQANTLQAIKALILLDMIGDRNLRARARCDVDTMAGRHHLGCGRPARSPQRVHQRQRRLRRRSRPLPERRRAGGRPHRSEQLRPLLAHGAGRPRARQRQEPEDRRRRRARRAARYRKAAAQNSEITSLKSPIDRSRIYFSSQWNRCRTR